MNKGTIDTERLVSDISRMSSFSPGDINGLLAAIEDRESGKETLSTCEADAWIDRIKTETKEEHVTRLRSTLPVFSDKSYFHLYMCFEIIEQ